MEQENPITVVVADDHAMLRAGLRALLGSQPDMDVIGDAGDGDTTLALVETLRPHILLLDIGMPGKDGLQTLAELQEQTPDTRVLMLTMYEDVPFLREALRLGARGYVPKRAADVDLLEAIRAVHRGEIYLHPSLSDLLMQDYLQTLRGEPNEPPSEEKPSPTEQYGLTVREIDVLKLVAQGYTDQQIADRLVISVRTVETHKANIRKKLGLRSRVELVRFALEHGLLES